MEKIKNRPPYLFGLLCVIPFVGLIIGVIMIYYGIVKYKNKVFIFIGTIGVIWTLFLCILFYIVANKTNSPQLIPLIQKELNTVDMALNQYKSDIGEYPDSLYQLDTLNISIPYNDPYKKISAFESNPDFNLKYQKTNNGYVLYSVGMDGKPNTTDDIYSKGSTK